MAELEFGPNGSHNSSSESAEKFKSIAPAADPTAKSGITSELHANVEVPMISLIFIIWRQGKSQHYQQRNSEEIEGVEGNIMLIVHVVSSIDLFVQIAVFQWSVLVVFRMVDQLVGQFG